MDDKFDKKKYLVIDLIHYDEIELSNVFQQFKNLIEKYLQYS